jgi:membrane-bound serine protease (ClpP class)
MAASIPGTGLPEATAVVSLALAAIGLTQLPVNLAGLALLLFVLEFQLMAHGALLVGGAVAFAIGALLLFRVTEGATALISWGTVLIVVGLSTAGFGVFIWRGLAAQRLPLTQDVNRVVGHNGVARTDVNGEGAVYVDGELWSARADEKIPAGSPVVVVKRDGLWLKVARPKKSEAGL